MKQEYALVELLGGTMFLPFFWLDFANTLLLWKAPLSGCPYFTLLNPAQFDWPLELLTRPWKTV